MNNVVVLNDWRAAKAAQMAQMPELECPRCWVSRKAVNVTPEGMETYRCVGPGHRPFFWRIDVDGAMLAGKVGKRHYAI